MWCYTCGVILSHLTISITHTHKNIKKHTQIHHYLNMNTIDLVICLRMSVFVVVVEDFACGCGCVCVMCGVWLRTLGLFRHMELEESLSVIKR